MKPLVVLLVMLVTAPLVFSACSDSDDGPSAETATPVVTGTLNATSTASATQPASPAARPTPVTSGVKVVDDIIAAVNADDAARLTELIHYWPRECSNTPAIGAVPCPDGTPEGTPVMVVGVSSGEGNFRPQGDDSIRQTTQAFVDAAETLYAVVQAPGYEGVPGTYQVVFEPGLTITADEEGITYMTLLPWQGSAAALVELRFGTSPDYLVRP